MTHDYLGTTINYTVPNKKVIINMDHYVDELLESVPEEMANGVATTPVATYLYDVDQEVEKLGSQQAEMFHTTITAKLLFLSKRARPDLQQVIGFLTT
jgi:hypothetical protein